MKSDFSRKGKWNYYGDDILSANEMTETTNNLERRIFLFGGISDPINPAISRVSNGLVLLDNEEEGFDLLYTLKHPFVTEMTSEEHYQDENEREEEECDPEIKVRSDSFSFFVFFRERGVVSRTGFLSRYMRNVLQDILHQLEDQDFFHTRIKTRVGKTSSNFLDFIVLLMKDSYLFRNAQVLNKRLGVYFIECPIKSGFYDFIFSSTNEVSKEEEIIIQSNLNHENYEEYLKKVRIRKGMKVEVLGHFGSWENEVLKKRLLSSDGDLKMLLKSYARFNKMIKNEGCCCRCCCECCCNGDDEEVFLDLLDKIREKNENNDREDMEEDEEDNNCDEQKISSFLSVCSEIEKRMRSRFLYDTPFLGRSQGEVVKHRGSKKKIKGMVSRKNRKYLQQINALCCDECSGSVVVSGGKEILGICLVLGGRSLRYNEKKMKLCEQKSEGGFFVYNFKDRYIRKKEKLRRLKGYPKKRKVTVEEDGDLGMYHIFLVLLILSVHVLCIFFLLL